MILLLLLEFSSSRSKKTKALRKRSLLKKKILPFRSKKTFQRNQPVFKKKIFLFHKKKKRFFKKFLFRPRKFPRRRRRKPADCPRLSSGLWRLRTASSSPFQKAGDDGVKRESFILEFSFSFFFSHTNPQFDSTQKHDETHKTAPAIVAEAPFWEFQIGLPVTVVRMHSFFLLLL